MTGATPGPWHTVCAVCLTVTGRLNRLPGPGRRVTNRGTRAGRAGLPQPRTVGHWRLSAGRRRRRRRFAEPSPRARGRNLPTRNRPAPAGPGRAATVYERRGRRLGGGSLHRRGDSDTKVFPAALGDSESEVSTGTVGPGSHAAGIRVHWATRKSPARRRRGGHRAPESDSKRRSHQSPRHTGAVTASRPGSLSPSHWHCTVARRRGRAASRGHPGMSQAT